MMLTVYVGKLSEILGYYYLHDQKWSLSDMNEFLIDEPWRNQ